MVEQVYIYGLEFVENLAEEKICNLLEDLGKSYGMKKELLWAFAEQMGFINYGLGLIFLLLL